MSTASISPLEAALRDAGEAWVIKYFGAPNEALNHIRRVLAEVQRRAQERLGTRAPNFTENAIVDEYQQHRSQVKGFFQALGMTRTPDMLLMVWRIIQGMEIERVELSYRKKDHFRVRVILISPSGEQDAPYESTRINDFALFRHIGILEMGDAPVFDGFYPLRVTGQ